MSRQLNYCIIIPAFNEAEHIGAVVKKCLSMCQAVIVVDDGSKDKTAYEAESAGANVLRHRKNSGKAAALATGFKYAIQKDFDYVITLDADGQHDPAEISNFLEEASRGQADIIIGSRMGNTHPMPLQRRFTNLASSKILSFIMGRAVSDSQSGYRMMKRAVIENVKMTKSGFQGESEFLIKAARKGFIIKEIPISTIYGGEKSKVHPVRDIAGFLRLAISYLVKRNE